ncbi:hypothetical protein [Priestia koreensis]|nr:hypothetical protein [Priestia koreensis]
MFRRRKKQRSIELEEMQHSLDQKLENLESLLKQLEKRPVEYHFHIQNVDIHQPVLKELSFHLDEIDIEEVSGALNVGNNFGVSVNKKKEEKQENTDEALRQVQPHEKGFNVSFNPKKKEE